MGKKLIEVKHHVRDYECMWAGIEDLYSETLGEILPPFFFFSISGTGNFAYAKGEQYRQAAWSNGMVDKMYAFMSPIAGFTYKHKEGMPFEEMISVAKQEIDEGRTIILGPVDMYELRYFPKIYKHIHIPIHYIMMVGYDDDKVYLIDGGQDKEDILYRAARENLVGVLQVLGEKNKVHQWLEAAKLFEQSGLKIEEMVNQIIDYLLKQRENLEEVPQMILEIADLEEKAYQQLLIRA
ncbi:MAG: BtrH N-terminal domain-containing protein [Cellulosilyticum sp.]|nr:BtrH N-terminal domain-containing protein [Cellulosilyticum sp.]